ncbi:hypothetical protein B7486_56400, partial [cyanobacterium TDX16]
LTDRAGGDPSATQFALNGLVLIVVAVLFPDGITGLASRLTNLVRRAGRTRDREAPAGAGSPSS